MAAKISSDHSIPPAENSSGSSPRRLADALRHPQISPTRHNLGWRCGSGSNRRIRVLQTLALPLGYRTVTEFGVPELLFGTYRACLPELNSAGAEATTGSNAYEYR